jgi:hypothetical protein
MELPTIIEAQNEAESSAKSIIAETLREGGDANAYSFTVTDDHGDQLLVFEFKKKLDGAGS